MLVMRFVQNQHINLKSFSYFKLVVIYYVYLMIIIYNYNKRIISNKYHPNENNNQDISKCLLVCFHKALTL